MNQQRFGFGVITFFVLGAAWLIGLAARADGAVDYCWIESNSGGGVPKTYYYLLGHRPWRADARMGVFESFGEAVDAASKADCPLRKP